MRGGPFLLTRYLRLTTEVWEREDADESALLVVYLEGDAPAWHADGVRVSATPPPVSPLALELAAADPAPAVAWLGRPCQLVAPEDASGCDPSLWSHRRFSEVVVSALDEALDSLRAEADADRLELVGYSGGGVLAVVLAARRTDVMRVVTLAAPLDLDAWTAHHELAPLAGQNPARLPRSALAAVRQRHWVGENDDIVPPAVLEGYERSHPAARIETVAGFGHGDWKKSWAERIAAARRAQP